MTDDELISAAQNPDTTPFDVIIVGSGAGGGPLAARLALGGKRVLLIEAGRDPEKEKSIDFPNAGAGEVFRVPGYHAAATEDKSLSWQFSVRHYAHTEVQREDEKYNRLGSAIDGVNYPPDPRFLDPKSNARSGKGGIFYPRSSGIGGCTAHHAMIMVAPNDRDWDHIADLTGDDSWRAANMRGYFAKLERCLYIEAYATALRRFLGVIYRAYEYLARLLRPRSLLDEGGHGREGWQPTSFIDPNLIRNIAKNDNRFFNVLARTAVNVVHRSRPLLGAIEKALFSFRVVPQLDPNDQNTRRLSPEGVFLIPTGIESSMRPDPEGQVMTGSRVGVREFLLETARKHPDRLVIASGRHVTRVIFAKSKGTEDTKDGGPPRAIGVDVAVGEHLYEASPLQGRKPTGYAQYYARQEIILCGGAFNTPQLLMLSGIGEREHLEALGIQGPSDANGDPVSEIVNLPGVGRNLQDRYEVSVISELDGEFSTLNGVSFNPGDPNDPARQSWLGDRTGLYAGNGGTMAVVMRSSALRSEEPEPDLFTFGVPAAFRGYYWGWSRELFKATMGADYEQRNLWSWVILKAYTRNNSGSVRLRSANPFDQPDICFDSFNEVAHNEAEELSAAIQKLIAAEEKVPSGMQARAIELEEILSHSKRDLEALMNAVAMMRDINARNPTQFVREIQPGPGRPDGSAELERWIRTQAWGHHASCTCRIGSDPWRDSPAKLLDKGAVIDSTFRVHGVGGLRIVDASVFPEIPGYFILTPIFMVSEKE